MKTLLFSLVLFLSTQSFAQTIPAEASLIDAFAQQGVPMTALARILTFLSDNTGKTLVVDKKFRPKGAKAFMAKDTVVVQNKYAAIIDYTLPSNQKRLFLLDLTHRKAETFYVSHGRNTGMLVATRFSNVNMSKMSSLGLVLTGDTYRGGHGLSLNLYGISPSNSQLALRDVVLHGADYVSEDFISKNGRLGVSWGCPAVEPADLNHILTALGQGSVILMHHEDLTEAASKTPDSQVLTNSPFLNTPIVDLPGEEEDIQTKK